MPDEVQAAGRLCLLAWLSPAFPVGSFAYSHGLESAIEAGLVSDRASLETWLAALVEHGYGWNDAVLLAEAWRETAAGRDVCHVAELVEALAGSRERHMETMLQGEAFGQAVADWTGISAPTAPYPVAVGQAAATSGIALGDTLVAWLHAFSANLMQVALRLVPLGQRDGVATQAALAALILRVAQQAETSSLDDLGGCTVTSDILSMRHETQYSRVFRS